MRSKNTVKVRGRELLMVHERALSGILETGTDFAKRTIYLTDSIDMDTATKFFIAFSKISETEGPIRIVLMSTGGSEAAGWAIYDLLRESTNTVVVDAYGSAFSIAALILQGGDIRRMSPECRFMVHAGTVTPGEDVDQRTLIALGKEATRTNLRYQEVLAERSGMPLERMTKYCDDETYFTAAEALQQGLIDAVIGAARPASENPKNQKKRRKLK